MNHTQKRTGFIRLWSFALVASICLTAEARANQPYIYKIEEDWELVVGSPQATLHSPQLSIYTTPDDSAPAVYFQLQLNHAAHEDFTGGGFMVSAVRDDTTIQEARSETREPLTQDGEQLRWTSVMATIGGELLYAIKDGEGSHWGSFGGPEYIVRMPSQGIDSLAGYSPTTSLQTVDIGFGANRVDSLILTKVRVYYTDDQMVETVIQQSP